MVLFLRDLCGFPLDRFPRLNAYFRRLRARPSFSAVCVVFLHAFVSVCVWLTVCLLGWVQSALLYYTALWCCVLCCGSGPGAEDAGSAHPSCLPDLPVLDQHHPRQGTPSSPRTLEGSGLGTPGHSARLVSALGAWLSLQIAEGQMQRE